jgi:hypothetical protein
MALLGRSSCRNCEEVIEGERERGREKDGLLEGFVCRYGKQITHNLPKNLSQHHSHPNLEILKPLEGSHFGFVFGV